MKIVKLAALCILFASVLNAQSLKITDYLKKVALGKSDEVKLALPDLLAEFPDDPGVQLLHAVVIEDAFKALDIYKEIVRKYPDSQWADDAFWRIIQFYAVIGDSSQARISLDKFRQNYPSSEYLAPATDIVASSIKIIKLGGKQNVVSKVASTKTDISTVKSMDTTKKQEDVKQDNNKNETGFWGLQVGVFRSKDKAFAERDAFLKQRLRTEVVEKEVNDETLFAVVIGNYTTKDAAEAAKEIVEKQCNCKPIVFKK